MDDSSLWSLILFLYWRKVLLCSSQWMPEEHNQWTRTIHPSSHCVFVWVTCSRSSKMFNLICCSVNRGLNILFFSGSRTLTNTRLNGFHHRLSTKLSLKLCLDRLNDLNRAALHDRRQRPGALPGHVQRRWQLLRRQIRKRQTETHGSSGLLLRLLVRPQRQPFVLELLLSLPAHAVRLQQLQPSFCQGPVGFPPPGANAEAPGLVQQASEEEELCSPQWRWGGGWGRGRRRIKIRLSELVRRNQNCRQAQAEASPFLSLALPLHSMPSLLCVRKHCFVDRPKP